MKNLLLLLLAITLLLSNCTNKEEVLQKAKVQAKLDSIKKAIEEENQILAKLIEEENQRLAKLIEEENQRLARLKDVLSIRKNSIDYDEPFTIYFGRKKVYAEEGDLKGFISVSAGISNEGSFLHFPTEESRESFINLIKYAQKKRKEWDKIAIKNKVKKMSKVIMTDTTKYWMSSYPTKFTEKMTLTASYEFIQVCERRDCFTSYVIIDFNETEGFSKAGDFKSIDLIGDVINEDINRTIDAFKTETINKFISKTKKEKKLFE